MSYVTSFSPHKDNQKFLASCKSKSHTVNKALDIYRKILLAHQMREGFSKQTDEDVALAMSDFGDYINIIEAHE